jgi:hypothetical protein
MTRIWIEHESHDNSQKIQKDHIIGEINCLEIYEYRLPFGTNIYMKYMILRIILTRCHTMIRTVK